jgi:hypothetical protein
MTAADHGHPPTTTDSGHPPTTADSGYPVAAADQPAAGLLTTEQAVPGAGPGRPTRSWRPLAILAAVQLLAGLLAGLVWRFTAPSTVSYLISGGDGKPAFVIPDEGESQIAGDGRFVLLSIALGMVFGLAAYRLRAIRGPIVLGVLAAIGLLSSVLARAVGELLSTGSADRKLDAAFTPQLSLHAVPALAVQAFFAVLVYTARAGLSSDPDLADSPDRTDRTHSPDRTDSPNPVDS